MECCDIESANNDSIKTCAHRTGIFKLLISIFYVGVNSYSDNLRLNQLVHRTIEDHKYSKDKRLCRPI